MKRHFTILLASLLMFSLITGCITNDNSNNTKINTSENASEPLIVDSVSGEESQTIAAPDNAANEKPKVFMTTDISPEGLMAVYEALDRNVTGKVAVKISTGEPGGHYYLSPGLIKDLVQSVNGTIVECNTAYGGGRAETAMHKQVAEDHGFTAIAPVDIMDEEGSISLPFENGKNIQEDLVGSHFKNYNSFIILSHFKGHAMAGFGGAFKNMAIGIASAEGKMWIHSAGRTKSLNDFSLAFSTDQDLFLESMAEAGGAVMNSLGDNIVYINVMNNLSVDCDCDSSPSEPTMKDIGILASLDPVALDQACVDLVYAAPDGQDLIERMESRNATHLLDHAEELGLGSKEYELVILDE
ncbi:Ferredoxin [Methanosarcina barkeri str. Wiesmoor]|uniref:Ferredoxin n=2 Tax=Methanosarcina barkeri TaxID=2208 RepID=A0A0E3QHT1_METBA|nr:DUF362 domain-containing protein [Methanosarcina barkeri]AKB49469.1 Ferredoxin [Methanosarcina barkeri str. Wiesmoor]